MAYVGEYRDRLRDGHGAYVFPGGGFRYEGDWKQGKMHGRGVLTLPDGSSYEGEFEDGEIDGIGLRRWPDGSTYNGQFHRGERHGEGVFISPSGEVYEGHWENSQRHGLGELRMARGDVYRGDFHRHKPHGNGRMRFIADGSTYDGDWVDGRICGRGVLKDVHGRQLYNGEWFHGQRCGHGVGVLTASIVFDGVWAEDKPMAPTMTLAFNVVVQPSPADLESVNEVKSASVEYQNPPSVITLSKSEGLRLPSLACVSLHVSPVDSVSSIVRGESGRQLRLRVFEGPIRVPGDSTEQAAPPSQWQFAVATKGPEHEEAPNQDPLESPEGEPAIPTPEEPRISEVAASSVAGVAVFDALIMPSASLVGMYHLVCDTVDSGDDLAPVSIALQIVE